MTFDELMKKGTELPIRGFEFSAVEGFENPDEPRLYCSAFDCSLDVPEAIRLRDALIELFPVEQTK